MYTWMKLSCVDECIHYLTTIYQHSTVNSLFKLHLHKINFKLAVNINMNQTEKGRGIKIKHCPNLSWLCDAVQLRGHCKPCMKTQGTLKTEAHFVATCWYCVWCMNSFPVPYCSQSIWRGQQKLESVQWECVILITETKFCNHVKIKMFL